MRRAIRDNSLGLFFGLIFLASLVGHAVAGWQAFNAEQAADGLGTLSLGRYLVSSDFAVDVTENWQSEYLQFLLFITATIWLLQRGSPESKGAEEGGSGVGQGPEGRGVRRRPFPELGRGRRPAACGPRCSRGR
ncbi:DUF6766 family protein [Nocardioides sp. HM23]|uniref:DUF6766 family protein n=1 Tax=Nocardioides bizhenqiangii TaxID=3095076 RepID=UPI002AC9F7D3|nr:DUF6766 family protein [Nocardioides sp. HM23]MDZ5619632.1 DUF6766 family protein [Nocardioides sp. HM23]